jgi:hypothetical protein
MTHMGKTRNVYRILVGRLKRRSHLGDLGVDERIIGAVVTQTMFTISDRVTAQGLVIQILETQREYGRSENSRDSLKITLGGVTDTWEQYYINLIRQDLLYINSTRIRIRHFQNLH